MDEVDKENSAGLTISATRVRFARGKGEGRERVLFAATGGEVLESCRDLRSYAVNSGVYCAGL